MKRDQTGDFISIAEALRNEREPATGPARVNSGGGSGHLANVYWIIGRSALLFLRDHLLGELGVGQSASVSFWPSASIHLRKS